MIVSLLTLSAFEIFPSCILIVPSVKKGELYAKLFVINESQ